MRSAKLSRVAHRRLPSGVAVLVVVTAIACCCTSIRVQRADASAPSGALSFAQLEGYWVAAGGPPDVAADAAAITSPESGYQPGAIQQGTSYCGAGSDKTGWGLWQITCGDSVPAFCVDFQILDPWNNAEAAVAKYKAAGNSFSPWTSYKSQKYYDALAANAPPPAPAQVTDLGQFVPIGVAPAGTHNTSQPGSTCGPTMPGAPGTASLSASTSNVASAGAAVTLTASSAGATTFAWSESPTSPAVAGLPTTGSSP